MSDYPKVPCPECGREYGRGPGITMHRKCAHGVKPVGAETEKRRKRDRERKRRARVLVPVVTETVDVGPELTADDILVSFVSMRWQKQMPTTVIAPLLEWREATSQMLERTR